MATKGESESENLEEDRADVIPGYKSIDDFTKEGYKVLIKAIGNSNALPCQNDFDYYSTNKAFSKIINDDGNNVLKMMNIILRNYEINGNIRNRSLDEKTELLVEANDNILERVAINLDEMNGIRKTTNEPLEIQTVSADISRVNGAWNKVNNVTVSTGVSITEVKKTHDNSIRLLTAKNIIRPQKFFKDKIDNSSVHPWEPRIKEKPNSLKPLAIFLEETDGGEEFCHPYEFELDHFQPLPEQLLKEDPVKPLPVAETPLVEITEPHQVDELVDALRECKEIAVDLEHHSYRTFMGITCLMQISTRTTDYIIDTLALRDKLFVLNEVFTKPTILKIFHGADMDIKWLQRDLSIYVVNMFDTYQAAKQLLFSARSLAYLMNRYCNFVPDKQFQLADWRIRPLPEELKMYAREDTHYLIYIYQMLKNELLEQANGQTNLLKSVITKSTDVAKTRYFKPMFREDSYMDFYRRCKRIFNNRQLYALKELYSWRDNLSRQEDESTGYVLPNHMLLQISENLPREMQGILACCNPIPPLVRANLLELHRIILKAREQPLERAIFQEDTRAKGITMKISKVNVDSPLHCPHDLSKSNEFRDDLPVILDKTLLNNKNDDVKLEIEAENSIYSVFNTVEAMLTDNEIEDKLKSIKFLGPFERYKLVRPYLEEQEKKEEAKRLKEAEERSKNSENPQEQIIERTDEDRIETIRQHFLSLSRCELPTAGESTLDKSLIHMGGSKKRKRSPSRQFDEDATSSSENVHTLPNVNRKANKRKSSEVQEGTNSKIKKHYDKSDPSSNRTSPHIRDNNQGKQTGNRKQNKNNYRNRNRQNKNKKTNPSQNEANECTTQNQESFQPYDYSSVDFQQFQGGAGQSRGQKTFKSKFKPRWKKKGNKGNKSETFGNVKKGTEYGR